MDGVYRIQAKLVDKAGNEITGSTTFSVNRFGSTFTYGNKETKKLLSKTGITNNAPDIVIVEYNVNAVKDQKIKNSCDGTSQKLENGRDYTVNSVGAKNDCHKYVYTINASNFTKEGNYIVTITSKDEVNNLLTNRTAYKSSNNSEHKIDRTCPISFTVDKTKPVITVTGVEAGELYEEATRTVKILCDDANLVASKLQIYFDGEKIKLGKDDIMVEDGSVNVKLDLEADGNTGERELRIVVNDSAGNVGEMIIDKFHLSASWIARVLHYNLPIVIAVIAAIIAAAVAIILISKKRRQGKTQ